LVSCTPAIGPVLFNATESAIDFEAHFEDGKEIKAFVEPGNTWWLSNDRSKLDALKITSGNDQIIQVDPQILRDWQIDTTRKNPLVIAIHGTSVEKVSRQVLDTAMKLYEKEHRE
jgi:hypothetical protein